MKILSIVVLTLATTISMQHARKIALAQVPHGTIQSAELEKENGRLIYSFDIKKKDSKDITEVNVDAHNGKVVAVQNESPAKEAAEKKAEQKTKH
jgi:uncharacterized membrane protein YkoI